MDWGNILVGLVIPIVITAIIGAWNLFLKRERVFARGFKIGKWASKFLNQKTGVTGGEKIQEKMKSTLDDFVDGIKSGMDEDNR